MNPTEQAKMKAEDSLEAAFDVILQHSRTEPNAAHIFDRVLQTIVLPYHRSFSWGDRLLTLDKSVGFKREPRFRAAIEIATTSKTGATQYASPDGIAWRINTLVWAAQHALEVPGDFVECGVFMGDMSLAVCETVDLQSAKKTFYLYDSFEGLSDQYSSPDDFPEAPQLYDFMNSAYKIDGLYETVRDRFVSKVYVRVIKGVVPDVLAETSPDTIAYLHLDMNSPMPEFLALEQLFDRVSPNGVIIFDDYGWILHRKQKDAADEFVSKRGYHILEMPTGQGLLIKR